VAAEEQDRGTAGESPRAALAHAKGDLDRAERELLTSAGDCASACRALASMERATGHLCALARAAGSQDDRSRCDEATAKVLEARVRVRSTCGTCEGGPSLERTAPIPSVRP
jgi:outer membrane protein TolC